MNRAFREYLFGLAEQFCFDREHLIFVTDVDSLRDEVKRWKSSEEYGDDICGVCISPEEGDVYSHSKIILIENGCSDSLKQIRNHFRDILDLRSAFEFRFALF